MENESKVVLGIFHSRTQIEDAIDDMHQQGFRNADFSALLPSTESTKEFAHENATKLPEGTAVGGTTGAIVGEVLGRLAGIGSLAIPGVGPFIAAGPIMGLLAGAGTPGAVGGLAGALIGMGLPEFEARRYEGMVKEGGYLISVHCDNDDWVDKAKNLLKAHGAKSVSSVGEAAADSREEVTGDKPRNLNYPS